jgi:hypothetical protein
MFSCVQQFVVAEVTEFKEDFRSDDREEDDDDDFIIPGCCNAIKDDVDTIEIDSLGSISSHESFEKAKKSGQPDVLFNDGSLESFESEPVETEPRLFQFPRIREKEVWYKGQRKDERFTPKKAEQRFRHLRGLPGKQSKRAGYSRDLWASLGNLNIGGAFSTEKKKPRWKTIRQFKWK